MVIVVLLFSLVMVLIGILLIKVIYNDGCRIFEGVVMIVVLLDEIV